MKGLRVYKCDPVTKKYLGHIDLPTAYAFQACHGKLRVTLADCSIAPWHGGYDLPLEEFAEAFFIEMEESPV